MRPKSECEYCTRRLPFCPFRDHGPGARSIKNNTSSRIHSVLSVYCTLAQQQYIAAGLVHAVHSHKIIPGTETLKQQQTNQPVSTYEAYTGAASLVVQLLEKMDAAGPCEYCAAPPSCLLFLSLAAEELFIARFARLTIFCRSYCRCVVVELVCLLLTTPCA